MASEMRERRCSSSSRRQAGLTDGGDMHHLCARPDLSSLSLCFLLVKGNSAERERLFFISCPKAQYEREEKVDDGVESALPRCRHYSHMVRHYMFNVLPD
ncbi:hypothetical protein ACLOJK_023308 [Asimina triloba]